MSALSQVTIELFYFMIYVYTFFYRLRLTTFLPSFLTLYLPLRTMFDLIHHSRNLLQVESLHSISEIDEQYKNEYKTDEIDQVRFKMFWKRHQRYQTICLPCVQARKRKEMEGIILDDKSSDSSSDGNGLASEDITISASNILSNWYAAARKNLSED